MFKNLFPGAKKAQNAAFGMREAMHNASNSYFYRLGSPIWMERNYVEFANQAYVRNVIAHRAINMVAHAAASVPLRVYRQIKGDRHPVVEHDIIDLLRSPNPSQSGIELLEAVYIYRQISGNAFILAIDNLERASEEKNGVAIKEIYTLRPDRVQIIAGESFCPLGYRYMIREKYCDYRVNPISGFSRVLHIKNFNPLSDWYGLSSVEAAAYSIDQHNQAGAWNQALLQNGARPSGVITVKDGEGKPMNLTEEQFCRLKSMIEESYSGPQHAGKPLVLEGGLEWKEMSLSPKDMDHIESKNNSAREIALAFGVPPQLLGIPGDNTYSNLSEARIALWEQTVLPLVDNTTSHLSRWLTRFFANDRYNLMGDNENLSIDYDADYISALAGRTEKIWARLEHASFMTMNEKRAAVGLAPLPKNRE